MDRLLQILNGAINQFKRVKVIKINDNFFDNELELMCNEKNSLYKIAQFCNDESESNRLWLEYRNYKIVYKNMICQKNTSATKEN